MKGSPKVALIFAFLVSIFVPVAALADEIGGVAAPTGIMALVVIIPLIVVLVLLFMRVDMAIAGLTGGVLAMLVGGIGLEETNKQMLEAVPMMLRITVPIINSTVAMAVFRAGSYSAALALTKQGTKRKIKYVSASIVILLATATYISGIGGGDAMVTAPLAFAAIGVVPELIAAVSLAVAVSFAASLAPLKSSIVSKLGDTSVGSYVSTTRPYWLFFVVLVIVLAFWKTKHKNVGLRESADNKFGKKSNGELFKVTLPAIFLLFAVIFEPIVSNLIGFAFFTPLVYMILALVLIFLYAGLPMNKSVEAMADGSTYILTRLFQAGIFLALISVIAQTGAFAVIADAVENAPTFIVVPVAILTGILTGILAGAYVGSVLTLVLPVAISLNFPPSALGFVTMGVGLDSQMSFVNITTQALSSSFQIPILDAVKGDVKWLSIASVLLLVIGLIFG